MSQVSTRFHHSPSFSGYRSSWSFYSILLRDLKGFPISKVGSCLRGPCFPLPWLSYLLFHPCFLYSYSPTRELHLHSSFLVFFFTPGTPSAGCCGCLPDSQWPNSCTTLKVQGNCHFLKSLPRFPQLKLISSTPCSQSIC